MKTILTLCILLIASSVAAFDYPSYVATKQDYINLLAMPEHRVRAIAELRAMAEANTAPVVRVISGPVEEKNLVTEEIPDPMPRWKRKRFESRDGVRRLINELSNHDP